jgi:uncharacterized alkaline shock family protein YloU
MTQAESMERLAETTAATSRVPTQSTGVTTLITDEGKTSIANGVVAKVAGIAAREIDGVYELVAAGAGAAALGTIARAVTGSEARDRGINVEVGEREAAVDLRMTVVYGASIPEVAQAVRQNIISRVREMTGLMVKEVNIDVVDLYFPGDERKEPAQPVVERRVQ